MQNQHFESWSKIVNRNILIDLYLPEPEKRWNFLQKQPTLLEAWRLYRTPEHNLAASEHFNGVAYGFNTVRHPLYHKFEEQQALWQQLDAALEAFMLRRFDPSI